MAENRIDIRARLRGARAASAEAKGLATSVGSVGVAAEAAGTASAAAARGGITQFQRGLTGIRSVGAKMGTVVESGLLRAAGALETFSTKADGLKKRGSQMRSTGRAMSYGLSLPLIGLGFLAVKTAADFQRSMAQVGIATGLAGKRLDGMKDLAMQMGQETIFSANDAALAMLNLVKAGMTPAQIKAGALRATMVMAAAGGMDLANAGNLIGAAMNTFGLEGGEAIKIADALAGAANESSADLQDLALGLQMAGQSAQMAGLNIFETAGSLAAMADQGLRGSDAGTSLKTFLMRLNPVQVKQKKIMNELGLSFFDANGQMVGMTEVSQRLRVALKGMTQEQRNQALATIFGSDAVRAANIVYQAGPKGLQKYIRATEKQGNAQKMANAQMKGLPGAIERLKGSFETAALAAGEAFAPVIIFVAEKLEWLFNKFTDLPKPIQTVIVTLAVLVALAGPVLFVLGVMATGFGMVAAGAGVLSTALLFLAANPVVLVAAAIVALGIALFIAYKKVGWFHDAVDAVFNFVKDNWRWLVIPLAVVVGPIIAIIANLDKLKAAWGWIKTAVENVINWYKTSDLGKIMSAPLRTQIFLIEKIIAGYEKVKNFLDSFSDEPTPTHYGPLNPRPKPGEGIGAGVGGRGPKFGDDPLDPKPIGVVPRPNFKMYQGPTSPRQRRREEGGRRPLSRPRVRGDGGPRTELMWQGGKKVIELHHTTKLGRKTIAKETTQYVLDEEARG